MRKKLDKEERDKRLKERRERYRNSWGSGVYFIETECGNSYIGSTKLLRVRYNRHNSNTVQSGSKIAGNYQIREFKILESIDNYTREVGRLTEQYWIDKLNPTLNKNKAAR